MKRRYQIQYVSEPISLEAGSGGVFVASWYQPLAEPVRPAAHLLTALQDFSALVIIPDDVIVSPCAPITPSIDIVIVRTTPRPNMPISFIRQAYNWSTSPSCDLTKEANGTYPYTG